MEKDEKDGAKNKMKKINYHQFIIGNCLHKIPFYDDGSSKYMSQPTA